MSDVNVTEETSKSYKATRRLYVDKDRERIVDENDPKAAFLLAAEGQEVSAEDVEKYGLAQSNVSEGDSKPQEASQGDASESTEKVEVKKEAAEPIATGTEPAKRGASKKSGKRTNTDPVRANKARR